MHNRFMFLRDANNNPVGCLSVSYENNALVYGMSVVNPKDKFDRKRARDIAEIRRSGDKFKTIPFPILKFNMHSVSEAVMLDITFDKHAPSRARKAAKMWLENNGR